MNKVIQLRRNVKNIKCFTNLKTITAIINILTSELVKLKMIIYKSLILLLIISWNQSDAKVINTKIVIGQRQRELKVIFSFLKDGEKQGSSTPADYCKSNVTAKAGMTARMYCCLGVKNKGAEVII